jgi:hypothetical protein
MISYDAAGNPILPVGVEEFLSGNPSTFIDRYLKTRHGPIVKLDGSGIVADDPDDVEVRVNNIQVSVKAVLGLLGVVVLDAAPVHGAVVTVRYEYLASPKVEFRRLNSVEFLLNQDGERAQGSQRYLYNSVLIDPSITNPLGFKGGVTGTNPVLHGYFYRAYERAYSVALNDPNLLLLNAPYHRVSYPPFSRELHQTLVSYDGDILPEVYPTNPWSRYGTGSTTIVDGKLVVADTSSGPFPSGKGLYYYRTEDLSFPNTFSLTFRNKINAYTLIRDFTGVSTGFFDGASLCLVSFLYYNGIKYVGVLTEGDETEFGSYITYPLDWSDFHVFRVYKTSTTVLVYVDNYVTPIISVATSLLPDINDLDIPIEFLSGTFFGSISRDATNVSEWDFVRYLIQPDEALESKNTVTVRYEANQVPGRVGDPWFRIGSFGSETILFGDNLLLDKYSASQAPLDIESGLLTGEVYGYYRPESFLSNSAIATVDFKVKANSWSHGVSERALGLFVTDAKKLIAISLFSDTALPVVSYNAQTVPEQDPEQPWVAVGPASTSIINNTLHVVDTVGGVTYTRNDGIDDVLGDSFVVEYRTKVNTYIPGVSGFAGVYAAIYDGVKHLEFMLCEVGVGSYAFSFVSNGTVLSSVLFNWNDSAFHTYRLIVNKPSNLVVLVIDGVYRGSIAYSSFLSGVGYKLFQFGSSDQSSFETVSNTDWKYFNVSPLRESGTSYAGLYLGGDTSDILNYAVTALDLTAHHEFRVIRDPTGSVSLSIDGSVVTTLAYENLPALSGTFFDITGAIPGVYWGSFDPKSLVLSDWDYVRYSLVGIYGNESIAPHHQFLNQENVMASADHLYGSDVHGHTDFDVSSTGIPTEIESYYGRRIATEAYTKLNDSTPPVPLTEEAVLTKVSTPIYALNSPLCLTNTPEFVTNDGTEEVEIQVSDRGLYNSLDLRSKSTGDEADLIAPAFDNGVSAITLDSRGTICFNYVGLVLPEETLYPIGVPSWVLEGTGLYTAYTSSGTLKFSNWGGSVKAYADYNPMFNASLRYIVNVSIVFRVLQDISGHAGDTLVRFEWDNGVYCIRLGLFTSSLGEKLVQIISVNHANTESVVGNITFNWDDASFHTYTMRIDPYQNVVGVNIDGRTPHYLDIPFSHLHQRLSIPKVSFTPKIVATNPGVSEIELDTLDFCVSRDEAYEMPKDQDPRAFFLNAISDYVYTPLSGPVQTVPASCVMNSFNNIMLVKSKAGEAYPELIINSQTTDTCASVVDESRTSDIVMTYMWGGNTLNNPASLMRCNMVSGWLLNDFTAGGSVYPFLLTPTISSAVLGATLVVSGVSLQSGVYTYNHDIRITGAGAVDLSAVAIVAAGGSWSATSITIPLSLIPGVSTGSQLLVKLFACLSSAIVIT